MNIKYIVFIVLISWTILCGIWLTPSEAAVNFSASKTGASDVTMGDAPGTSVTYTITNTGSDGIVKIAFRLPNANISTGSFTWTGANSLPSGWAVTKGMGTREITVQGPAITPGTNASFGFTIGGIPTWTQDTVDLLDRIRAFNATGKNPKDVRNLTLFTRHALRILSMTAPGTVAPGSGFSLVITVKNESSTTLNSIISDPNPPTMAVLSGTITSQTKNQSPTPSPNPLPLAAGATGSITYNYSTRSGDNGSISFTARVRHPSTGSATATSLTATSNTVVIGGFVGSISHSNCVYTSNTIDVTMSLSNFTASAITNVTPSITPAGTATKTLLTGPTPTPPINIPANSTTTFTWTYRITGILDDTYSFSGGATGSSAATVSPSNQGSVGDFTVSMFSNQTNASSTNQELTWTVTNKGCAAIQSVSVSYPAGWIYSNDSYSLINATDESWTTTGSNPILFSAPASANQMPVNAGGDFMIVFSAMPTTTGANTFNVTITDANATPIVKTYAISVTVNPFNSSPGGPNAADTEVWKESY